MKVKKTALIHSTIQIVVFSILTGGDFINPVFNLTEIENLLAIGLWCSFNFLLLPLIIAFINKLWNKTSRENVVIKGLKIVLIGIIGGLFLVTFNLFYHRLDSFISKGNFAFEHYSSYYLFILISASLVITLGEIVNRKKWNISLKTEKTIRAIKHIVLRPLIFFLGVILVLQLLVKTNLMSDSGSLFFLFGCIVLWPLLLAIEFIWFRKNNKPKTIALVFLLTLTLCSYTTVYFIAFKPKHLYSSYSPDNKYELKVYEKPKFFSMPGDGSTKCAIVELHKGFWRIDNCEDCPTFTNEIEIRWEMDDDLVFFSRGHGINLKTGNCE